MMTEISDRAVVAVVAAFDPGPGLVKVLEPLCRQCDRVIVVEDGTHVLDPDRPPMSGVEVISLRENRGIASALNVGIHAALGSVNDPLVLTMDQDSRVSDGYVEATRVELASALRHGLRVGAVGAEAHNGHEVRMMRGLIRGHRLLFDPMQSGTLYPSETFEAVGLLEEDFVIDAVDTEFNLRMLAAGLVQLAAPGADLQHELGAMRPLTILGWNPKLRGRPLRIHYHAPFRTYFITRNNMTVWKRYARRFPRWIMRRASLEFESAAVCLVYGPERRRHIRAMRAGAADALASRLGPMPGRLRSTLGR